jgi:hypothetical protein
LLSRIAKQLDIADRGRFDADKCRVKAAITKVEQNRNKTFPNPLLQVWGIAEKDH